MEWFNDAQFDGTPVENNYPIKLYGVKDPGVVQPSMPLTILYEAVLIPRDIASFSEVYASATNDKIVLQAKKDASAESYEIRSSQLVTSPIVKQQTDLTFDSNEMFTIEVALTDVKPDE